MLSKDMKITTVVIGQSIPPKQIVLLTLPVSSSKLTQVIETMATTAYHLRGQR
jgi:uncharacterized Zn finger protein